MKDEWIKFDDSILYNEKKGLFWVKGMTPNGYPVTAGMFFDWRDAHKKRDELQLLGHLQFDFS